MRTPGLRAPGPEETALRAGGDGLGQQNPSMPRHGQCPAKAPPSDALTAFSARPRHGWVAAQRPGWCELPGVASSAGFETRTVKRVPAGGPEMTAARCFIPEPAVDPAAADTRSRAGRERGHQARRVMAPLDGPCPAPSSLV